MNDTLTDAMRNGLRMLARARGPADRNAVPYTVRYALYRRGLVNGAWQVTSAGKPHVVRNGRTRKARVR